MAINNQLAPQQRQTQRSGIVEFTVGNDTVKLSPQIIRTYLTNGKGNVTDQEISYFIHLCKAQQLNPFIKEAHLIKYSDSSPATIVVGKDAFLKRAESSPDFDGMEAGIIVLSEQGFEYRKGALVVDGENIIGGWAKVYRKGRSIPTECEVSFSEYAGRKGDGSLNSQWATKPATMIRKVAMVHALREAFPTTFSQMYTAEETNVDIPLDETPIEQPKVELKPSQRVPVQPQVNHPTEELSLI